MNTCRDGRFRIELNEHESILNAIQARDPERAAEAMAHNMRMHRLQIISLKEMEQMVE